MATPVQPKWVAVFIFDVVSPCYWVGHRQVSPVATFLTTTLVLQGKTVGKVPRGGGYPQMAEKLKQYVRVLLRDRPLNPSLEKSTCLPVGGVLPFR